MLAADWPTIIDDVHHRLPNSAYLDFVVSTLLGNNPITPGIDPFGIDLPIAITDYYVDRDEIEKEILLPGTRIILGKYGSGKTTLFHKLSKDLKIRKGILLVEILLNEGGLKILNTQESPEEKTSLSLDSLIHIIFNAYWENFILPVSSARATSEEARQYFLPWFRRERGWMTLLSWFFHHYPPLHRNISDDFELVAWLEYTKKNDLFDRRVQSETLLRELISLIFYITEIKDLTGKPFGPRYRKVIILVDGAETLSPSSSKMLLQDFQHLLDQRIPGLEVLFFAESGKKGIFENLECVQDGRAAIYELPPWTDAKLRDLLSLRRKICMLGTYSKSDPWALALPPDRISYSARFSLADDLIAGVKRPDLQQQRFDAPIHLLKLTRGAVAACAGCWQTSGVALPISREDITALIDAYWRYLLP